MLQNSESEGAPLFCAHSEFVSSRTWGVLRGDMGRVLRDGRYVAVHTPHSKDARIPAGGWVGGPAPGVPAVLGRGRGRGQDQDDGGGEAES